jgi:hypothetical protein
MTRNGLLGQKLIEFIGLIVIGICFGYNEKNTRHSQIWFYVTRLRPSRRKVDLIEGGSMPNLSCIND